MIIRMLITSISASFITAVAAVAQAPAPPQSARTDEQEKQSVEESARSAGEAAERAANETSEMTQRAKASAQAVHSEAFRALMNEMSPRLLEALGVEDETNNTTVADGLPADRPGLNTLAFVSSSIPLHILRSYAGQLEPIDGAMILRGGVRGLTEIGPTIDFIMEILKVDPRCTGRHCDMRDVSVLIDPVLFTQAGVTRVPAVAIVDHDPFASYCERNTKSARMDSWRITYGDASLEGHFEELDRIGEPRAAAMLATIRGEETP